MPYSVIVDENVITFLIRKLEVLLSLAKKEKETSKLVWDVFIYFFDIYILQIDCEIDNPLIFFDEMDLNRFNFWAYSWTDYDLNEIEKLSIKYL
tara:strand:+ start:83 stop:364 length:282 start_codon:yes stop_codon:yes gene_type:complete